MQGIREANFGSRGSRSSSFIVTALFLLSMSGQALAQAIPQKNVNVIGPAPPQWLYSGNPRLQQNEPDGVESVVFPGHVAIGFNDYRAVNDPAIAEAFPGIAMSRDGETWISGLIPGHFADNPSLGQPGGADPNLEIAPYMMFYNFIAFSRDDSTVPGVYLARWYEPNTDVGPPFRHLDNITVNTGTTSKFLDKPSFKSAVRNPADGLPDIEVPIPAYQDPLNAAIFNDAYVLKVPALRLHLCYSVFVGNDNNAGTKIECLASDNGGVTFSIKNKLSESVEINQGTNIATRNFGKDVVVTWARFEDNNETAAIMYAMSTDYGNTFSKAKVVTEFCPFNQTTGAARFRTNALPVIVSNDDEFAIFIASRNGATETCKIRGKGNAPDTPRMSPVTLADDFDSFGEEIVGGIRTKDGMVRTSLNFSRVMMIRGNGNGNISWGTPVAVDAQEVPTTVATDARPAGVMARSRSHQFMPACDAAGGIETCSWYDSRLDKFNSIMQHLPAAPFVEDMVLHLEPGVPFVTPTLLPAGAYEGVPDVTELPPNVNNLPLRRTIDVFAAQIQGGSVRPYTVNEDTFYATGASDPGMTISPSVRVSRFPTRQKPGGAPGVREQVEWNYPNARLFQKGKAGFIGDYHAMFAKSLRKNAADQWVSNQSAPDPATDLFSSTEPVFRVGWTSNRNVRGRVFYTGCDEWDPVEQIWKARTGTDGNPVACNSPYTDPDMLLPLQGEDGSNDGPPLTCSAANLLGRARAPLTRNQNIYTAAMAPGINASVVSAIKPANGSRSTFVLQLLNGSTADRRVNLTMPAESHVSFGADAEDTLLSIPVVVPGGAGNVRTAFDFGDENKLNMEDPGYDPDYVLSPSVILTVTDADSDEILARVPLVRADLETPPLGNVQSNPDDPGDPADPFVDLLGGGEFYDLVLKRQIGVDATFELENFELENTAELFDLENLDLENFDLENKLVFFELENFELENTDLRNDLYQAFDLENTVINLNNPGEEDSLLYFDLENFELENFELENFDLENFELENFELENFDLENFDLENFELENETVFASSIDNFELENFELENSVVPGDEFTEISWTADSSSNTTTGVDVKPIFTSSLANKLVANNSTVVLTVRRGYLNGTVGYASSLANCSAEIVVDNQVLYATVLTPDQVMQSVFLGTVTDPDPTVADTPGFFLTPDGSTVVSLRVINPPADLSFEELNANAGAALFTQPGNTVDCDLELPGGDPIDACEVDFTPPDLTAPVIALNGNANVLVDQGQVYVDPGATASDDVDGDISGLIVASGWDMDTSVPGVYSIYYNVMDAAGNPADTIERTVTVIDREKPVISLIGNSPATAEAGSLYTDPGATASDNVDGDVSGDIVTSGWNLDTTATGSFSIYYDVVDAAGNSAIQVTRTVNVVDTIAPVITLLGNDPLVLEAGDAYAEPGATVSDAGDPSVMISIDSSAVNSAVVGTYSVTYDATDASGNAAVQRTRTVTVTDTSVPVISGISPPIFTPPEPFILAPGETMFVIEWPVGANDPNPGLMVYCDVGLPPTRIYPTVSSSGGSILYTFSYPFAAGTTAVTCAAIDQGGNSDSGSFTVTVEDIPVIDTGSLPAQPFTVEANDPTGYIGQTAGLWGPITATDLIDGSIEAACTPANDLLLGANTISCVATDSAGNMSDEVTFPATVVDTTAPSISVIDDPFVIVTTDVSATVFESELIPNVAASDIVDGTDVDIACSLPGVGDSASFPLGIHADVASCTATDQSGNQSAPVVFDVEIRFAYGIVVAQLKGNINAGSTAAIDWYYVETGTSIRVNTSGLSPLIEWFGPFTDRNCTVGSDGSGDGSAAEDSGNSDFRYSMPDDSWRLNWQTPGQAGYFRVVISPPGAFDPAAAQCVRTR